MRQTKYTIVFSGAEEIVKFWSDGERGKQEAMILAQAERIRLDRDFEILDVIVEDTEETRLIDLGPEKTEED